MILFKEKILILGEVLDKLMKFSVYIREVLLKK